MPYSKVINVILGGDTRQLSVYEALKYLKSINVNEKDNILIHDGARANVSDEIITNSILKLEKSSAVNTLVPINDTLIQIKYNEFNLLNRDEIYSVQTPQSFHFDVIFNAHNHFYNIGKFDFTDDVSMVSELKNSVDFIVGNKLNFKITTKEDLELFEAILNLRKSL